MPNRFSTPNYYFFFIFFGYSLNLVKTQFVSPEIQQESSEMPKGVFHYRKTESGLKNEFHVPDSDLSNPMEMATELINTAMAQSTQKQQALSGVQIPLPFGLRPLNIQLGQDSETRMGVSHTDDTVSSTVSPEKTKENHEKRRAPDLNSRSKTALEKARQICLRKPQKVCDAALDDYHRIRYGYSAISNQEKLRNSQPKDMGSYLQTGMAKWFVPGLNKSLNNMVLNQTDSTESSEESEISTEEDPPTNPTTKMPEPPVPTTTKSEIRRYPIRQKTQIRRRIRVKLPLRTPISLPPRN